MLLPCYNDSSLLTCLSKYVINYQYRQCRGILWFANYSNDKISGGIKNEFGKRIDYR